MNTTTKNAPAGAATPNQGNAHNIPAGDLMNNTKVAPTTDIRCPINLAGCTGERHTADDTGSEEDRGWHTAFYRSGDEWHVTAERFNGDGEWKVYGRLEDDDEPLTANKVVSFYDAWIEARNITHDLNAEVR
jgi:hypothetical protein